MRRGRAGAGWGRVCMAWVGCVGGGGGVGGVGMGSGVQARPDAAGVVESSSTDNKADVVFATSKHVYSVSTIGLNAVYAPVILSARGEKKGHKRHRSAVLPAFFLPTARHAIASEGEVLE